MSKYELMYIVSTDLEEAEFEAVQARINAILESNVTIDNTDHIGRKRFAYEIDHKTEGDYTVVNFTAEPSAIETINNEFLIVEGLVRHLIVLDE